MSIPEIFQATMQCEPCSVTYDSHIVIHGYLRINSGMLHHNPSAFIEASTTYAFAILGIFYILLALLINVFSKWKLNIPVVRSWHLDAGFIAVDL